MLRLYNRPPKAPSTTPSALFRRSGTRLPVASQVRVRLPRRLHVYSRKEGKGMPRPRLSPARSTPADSRSNRERLFQRARVSRDEASPVR